jgi:hypothetical protein
MVAPARFIVDRFPRRAPVDRFFVDLPRLLLLLPRLRALLARLDDLPVDFLVAFFLAIRSLLAASGQS